MTRNTDVLQSALRLLFLLDRAGTAPRPGSPAEAAGAVAVMESEKRLQALHFWMRNPDYLANEILDCVARGAPDALSIEDAEELLDGGEPELRLYPMLRNLFGAYEPIDDSMSHLVSVGLALCRRVGDPTGRKQTSYWLLPEGRAAAVRILHDHPSLAWYGERADLVALVAGPGSGSGLKHRHYDIPDYKTTPIGQVIPSITEQVRKRIADMRATVA